MKSSNEDNDGSTTPRAINPTCIDSEKSLAVMHSDDTVFFMSDDMPCTTPNAKAVGDVRSPTAGKWIKSCRPSAREADNNN